MLLTVILVRGIRESARTNNILVLIKIGAILVFVFAAASFVKPALLASLHAQRLDRRTDRRIHHLFHVHRLRLRLHRRRGMQESSARPSLRHPCYPRRLHHPLWRRGHCPQRHRALAIGDGRCRTGGERHQKAHGQFGTQHAGLGTAICADRRHAGHDLLHPRLPAWPGPRLVRHVARRPAAHLFGRIHPRFRTPAIATWVAGFVVGIPAGLLDIGTVSNLSNIGTLFAFVLVSIAVLILRYREPERPRAFRAPFGPSSRCSASSSAWSS